MSNFKDILEMIQSSRPKPMPTLYGGDLQGNTDEYFKPSPFNNQDDVPNAPPKLYRESGATVEIDKRPFMTPQPQVPRNLELENLNEYFNKKRISDYVAYQSSLGVEEKLAKMAELQANSVVKDEIDRRVGIRRAVLEATGLTPAQVQEQLARETLAGANPRVLDVTARQVQDAVNMYYNINNIPLPVNAPAQPDRAFVNTVPQQLLPEGVETDLQDINDENDGEQRAAEEDQLNTQIDQVVKPNFDDDGEEPAAAATEGAVSAGLPRITLRETPESVGIQIRRELEMIGSTINWLNRLSALDLVRLVKMMDIRLEGITTTLDGQFYTDETMRRKRFTGERAPASIQAVANWLDDHFESVPERASSSNAAGGSFWLNHNSY